MTVNHHRLVRQMLAADQLLGAQAVPASWLGPLAEAPAEAVASASASASSPVPAGTRGSERPSSRRDQPARAGAPSAGASPPAPAARPRAAPASPSRAPAPSEPALIPQAASPARISLHDGLPEPGPPSSLDRAGKLKILTEMDQNEVRSCNKCILCESRTQTVFADGDPEAQIMFIGEAPGQTEDEQGLPFVGKAGDLLNKMITAMGLSRESIYIANVLKCRPPNNRPPAMDEIDSCRGYLERQIETVRPRVMVTLGGPATKLILETKQGITSIRGIWHGYHGLGPEAPPIPVMPTFHPAYLLRSYTVENRKRVWEDLQKVMDLLHTLS